MALSRTQIANLALAHLGVGAGIEDVDTDNSMEARVIRQFWDTVRDATLRNFPWPFAKKTITLQLIETDPTEEWAYSYQYPQDCVRFYRIHPGGQEYYQDNRQDRVPHEIVNSASGKAIHTNEQDAVGDYCLRVTETAFWEADFITAFSLRLANYIAPRVTGGDPFKLGEKAMRAYLLEISSAEANAGNENQDPEEPNSEFQRARA